MVLTKAQSKSAFTKVLKEDLSIEDTSSLMKALAEMEIDNIVDLQCLTDEDIEGLYYMEMVQEKETQKRVTFKEKKLLKQLLQWADYNASNKADRQVHWEDFTPDTLDEYKQVAAATLSGRDKSRKTDTTSVLNKIERFETNVKMDVKQFSIFDGSLEKWLNWKRTTVAQLITYGLKDVTSLTEPKFAAGSTDEILYQKQNLFFYSVLTARVTGGHALTIVREHELTRDGRKCYEVMLAWYEATNNLVLVGSKALNRLTSLRLTYNSKGGIAAYIKQFSECILDLEHAKQPLLETQKKTMFLNGILDTAYSAKIDLLKEDTSKDFATVREQIAQKGEEIETRRGPKRENRQVNSQTTSEKGGKGKYNNKKKGQHKNHNDYVKPDEWAKLSPQQKKEIIEKRKQ